MSKYNFTKSLLDNFALPKGGERTVIWDTQITGLQCRITSSGVKTFSVLRRINGRLERVTIGKYPDINIMKARALAGKVNDAIASGNNPAEAKRAFKEEPTLDDLFALYFEKHAKPKKRTAKEDKGRYDLHVRKPLGHMKVSAIGNVQIANLLASITSQVKTSKKANTKIKYKSGATANRVHALLSSMFNWGISMGECKENPTKGIKKNPEQSRDRFLQADELPRFFASLKVEENVIIRDFILVALLTGARRENVQAMNWQDISFERKEWRIHRTKNNESQVIPLGKEVIKILKQRQIDNCKVLEELKLIDMGYVFPGSGKFGYLAEPKKGWQRILDRAQITNLRIHDLRRTFGSWQAKTGASLIVVGKSLGHKSMQSTAVYARLDLDPVRESMQSATSAILKASNKKVKGHPATF